MNPRTLCACHSVAFIISARVAPLARPIISRIFAPLLSGRGVVVLAARSGLSAFLLALAAFFCAVALVLAPLAVLWPWGAPFSRLAPFFDRALSGATCAPCSATVAVFAAALASVFVILFLVVLFCAGFAHDDSSLWRCGKAREKWPAPRRLDEKVNTW